VDFEHIGEFYEVREAACDGLRSGRFVEGEAGSTLCRLVVLPSFENAVAWDVLSLPTRGATARTRLLRSCWRQDLDLHALGSPVERLRHSRPYRATVEVGSAPIDTAEIEGLVLRLRTIPVPLSVARPPFGVDGTSYELEIGGASCKARIAWWAHLPEEWEVLGPVVEEMCSLFESSWRDA